VRSERLSDPHSLREFDCGNKMLNEWFHLHALENQMRNLSRTFVLGDESEFIVGYYSLTAGGVRRENLPTGLGRGLPAVDIGMVLRGRLAIDTSYHRPGFGRDLMVDAIIHAAAAGENAAASIIAVGPIEVSAQSFYESFSFRRIPGDAVGRMYLRIDDALATLDNGSDGDGNAERWNPYGARRSPHQSRMDH
jgi:GNAT superfamily N-acetyltransferase